MIHFRPIAKIIGILLSVIGLMMLAVVPFTLYYDSGDTSPIFISAMICALIGLPCALIKLPGGYQVNKREGYLVVALGWFSMILFGMLPYLLSASIPNITDAFFEMASGLTTTGATIMEDIESHSKGILMWRSMTQWIGGMGIIVLTVALFPLLGFGGIELFVAEAPGPKSDKIHPRIQETAKRLWLIYVALTVVLSIILYFGGMSGYDAINHALTTMSTGGFSTRNASLMYWDSPFIHYVVIIFMCVAGTNFTVLYFLLKGKIRRAWNSEEFRTYVAFVLVLGVLLSVAMLKYVDESVELRIREGLFMMVSIITTTGYVIADYTSWAPGLTLFFFVLMFAGASAGSTSGGIKLVRHLVFVKNSILEFKRILHPRAIVPLKLSGNVVPPRVMTHILVFLLIYLFLFILGSMVLAALGLDFYTAIGATATSLANVGPGIGNVGPMDNFAALPAAAKWFLTFLMLAGRLELFTILVLFTPYFWKQN